MEYHGKLERIDLIIRNFDEVIQTKTSKITVENLNNKIENTCVDRTELDVFFKKANKVQKQSEENQSLQQLMIEELETSLKKFVTSEVYNQTMDIRQSPFNEPVQIRTSSPSHGNKKEIQK